MDINAQMAALELSYDFDYIRYRASVLYMSGDRDPRTSRPPASTPSSTTPTSPAAGSATSPARPSRCWAPASASPAHNSFIPDLRTSKEEGQANFVNPGLLLYNVGADFNLTQRLTLITNASYLQFVNTSTIQEVEQI